MLFKSKSLMIIILVALVAVVVGFVAGLHLGGSTMRDTTWRLALPSMLASGEQARRALVMIENGDIETLKVYLEAEVDHSIAFLEHVEDAEGALSDRFGFDPLERLKKYRETHPRDEEN